MLACLLFLFHFFVSGHNVICSSKEIAAATATVELIASLLTLRNVLLTGTIDPINFHGVVFNSTL